MKNNNTVQYDLPGEEWKDIDSFPETKGIYWISNFGRYKSMRKNKIHYSLGSKASKGYRKIALCIDGKVIASPCIHDVVVDTFVRKFDRVTEQVHHRNHFPNCNKLSNLIILDKHTHHSNDEITNKRISQAKKRKV